jgi:subtilisin-like proprotein convertase family protein
LENYFSRGSIKLNKIHNKVPMKKSIKLIVPIILTVFVISCSKNDDEPQPANKDLVFENSNSVNIIEKTEGIPPTPTISEINVTATGTLKNLSKFTLEMNIQHDYQRDLEFLLIAPDGTSRTFIYRRGLSGKFLANQKLRFNNSFTADLPDDGANFLTGNYKECKGSVSSLPPVVEPIFSSFLNKNINGVWKLKVLDWEVVNSGNIVSWRLIFSEGAI